MRFTIETGERFGRLVSMGDRLRPSRSRQTCFERFYQRDAPCERCPLRETPRSGVFVTQPAEGEGAPMLMLVAERGSRADVMVVELDAAVSHDVCRGWIARLERENDLSAQERNVLELLLLGRTHRDIGVVMGISTRTVRFHQSNLLEKLGAETRADLLRLLIGADMPARPKARATTRRRREARA